MFAVSYSVNNHVQTYSDGSTYSNGGGSNNTIGTTVAAPTPPPPLPCTLTLDRKAVAAGTSTLTLSWKPLPKGVVTLKSSTGSRMTLNNKGVSVTTVGGALTVPKLATSYSDIVGFVLPKNSTQETNTYTLSYNASTTPTSKTVSAFACTAPLKIVQTLTECNDGIDNADPEDTLIDQQDPACHSDGNPANTASYVSTTTSETNNPPNLVSTIESSAVAGKGATDVFDINKYVYLRSTTTNASLIYASANVYSIGWRLKGVPFSCVGGLVQQPATINAWKPSGSTNTCFVSGGNAYLQGFTATNPFIKNQSHVGSTFFGPTLPGDYEVCAVADVNKTLIETNEADNIACKTVTVKAPLSVGVNIRTAGDTIWHSTVTLMSTTTQVELQWVPDPTAVSCKSNSPAYFTLPPQAAINKLPGIVSNVVEPKSGSFAYVVQCVDTKGAIGTGFATANINTITGSLQLTATPSRLRSGDATKLSWNLNGRNACTLTGTNGQVINLAGTPSSGTATTPSFISETKYTLSCADDNASTDVTIKLIPVYKEI